MVLIVVVNASWEGRIYFVFGSNKGVRFVLGRSYLSNNFFYREFFFLLIDV